MTKGEIISLIIAGLGIIIAVIGIILSPILSHWLTLHAPTKEAFRKKLKDFKFAVIVRFGFIYTIGLLIYYLFEDVPISKWYIFKVGLTFTALSIYISLLLTIRVLSRIQQLVKSMLELFENQETDQSPKP